MSTLRVLAWNVQTGNREAIDALTTLAKEHHPHVIVITEAVYLHEKLTAWAKGHGYSLFMEEPPHFRPGFGVVPEQGDTAVLVHRTAKVAAYHVAAMTQTWTGPKHDWLHAPRRYWRLRVKVGGKTWRLSGDHWPTKQPKNIKAQTETKARATKWLRRGLLSSSALIGDLNTPTASLAADFPKASVIGNGPDNAIHVRCKGQRVVLGNYGSDHKAVVYTFTR